MQANAQAFCYACRSQPFIAVCLDVKTPKLLKYIRRLCFPGFFLHPGIKAASTAGCSGITDEGLNKLIGLAFSFDTEAVQLVDRRNKASWLVGEAFLRGQDAALANKCKALQDGTEGSDVFIVHRSWDDATLRMFFNNDLVARCQDSPVPGFGLRLSMCSVGCLFLSVFKEACFLSLNIPRKRSACPLQL